MQQANSGDIIQDLNVSCLYKYLKIDSEFPTIDKLLTFKLSSPSQMNDPFEFLIGKIENITKEQAEYLRKKGYRLKKTVQGINQYFDDEHDSILKKQYECLNNHIRITCFSTDNSNILMWSHYTNNHKGFVIEYDIEKIMQRFSYEKRPICLSPVQYSSDMPSIRNLIVLDELERGKEMYKVICTKANNWNYENEWRIVISDFSRKLKEKENIELTIMPEEIKSIYFGVRCPQEDINRIRSIAEKLGIKCSFFKASINKEHYKLDFTII